MERNYGVKITHDDDKKEIHIQANLYFTNSEDLSENIEAIIMWGLSEGTYTTQDGISYDISFDLKAKVIEGKEETDEARADPIGNIIHENDEIQFRRNYEDDFKRKFNDLTGGYTKNNLAIYNRRSVANAMTRGHEIGHLFGLKDNSGGIMDYSHSFATMKKLNDTNLTKVIKNTLRDIQRIEKGKKARNNAFKIYNIMGEYQGDKSFYKKGVINFKK